ncbi:MAG: chorismate mutase [Patescibacteria group bacterium]
MNTKKVKSEDIDGWRKQLDKIDDQIIDLLAARMVSIAHIGKYKKERNIQPLDPKRWKQVMEKRLAMAKKHKLSEDMIRDIYETIHHHALLHEEKV